MFWANGTAAFITGAGEKDIVLIALFSMFLSIVCLAILLLGLLKKAYPSKQLHRVLPLIFLGIIFIFSSISYLSTKPVICATCHAMKPAIRDLSYTEHSEITCMQCHKKAGIFGLPIQNISQVAMITSYFRNNYRQPIITAVSNETCLECHADVLKSYKLVKGKRIKVSHKETVQAKVACTECHIDTAHNKQGPRESMMEKCSGCHNDEKASSRCSTCHLGKVGFGTLPTGDWSIKHTADWPELHGTKSLNACGFCHEKRYCNQCHETNVPHPDGWSFIHGDEAKRNRKDCITCHKQESSCIACHKIAMPHTENWLALHVVKVEATGKAVCETCHEENDCDACHKKHKESIKTMRRGLRDLQRDSDE